MIFDIKNKFENDNFISLKQKNLDTKLSNMNDALGLNIFNIKNKNADSVEFNIENINLQLAKKLINKNYSIIIIHNIIGVKVRYSLNEYIAIEEAINKIINEIDINWCEQEKAEYLYKKLGSTIIYDANVGQEDQGIFEEEKPIRIRSLYGPLVENKAVCVGYAVAFSEICKRLGIECEIIVPHSKKGNHVWNSIKIDNNWYYCDLTLDVQNIGNCLPLKYFCISKAEMKRDHKF